MADSDLAKILNGYGLLTANIFYRMPERSLLQEYIYQCYDIAPKFPGLYHFLQFWSSSLDGIIHSVVIAHAGLIKPAEIRMTNFERLH